MAEATTTFDVDGPITLQVRLLGAVSVFAREDLREARVTLTPRDASGDALDRTVVELSRSTLVVAGPRNSGGIAARLANLVRERDTVDAHIELPAGSTMKIATMHGDISLAGACGGADLTTGSGEITVERVNGDLRLRIGSGESRVGPVTGSVATKAGSGNIHLAEVGGSLENAVGSGDLHAGPVRGSLKSRAGSGDVQVDAVHGDVDVASGSGSIRLGLPSGVSARLDVTTGSGQVQSDLPVEQSPAGNARSITVRARTGSGDVRLVRAGSTVEKKL